MHHVSSEMLLLNENSKSNYRIVILHCVAELYANRYFIDNPGSFQQKNGKIR